MKKAPNVSLEYKRWNIWVILYLMKVLRETLGMEIPHIHKAPVRISWVDGVLSQVC